MDKRKSTRTPKTPPEASGRVVKIDQWLKRKQGKGAPAREAQSVPETRIAKANRWLDDKQAKLDAAREKQDATRARRKSAKPKYGPIMSLIRGGAYGLLIAAAITFGVIILGGLLPMLGI